MEDLSVDPLKARLIPEFGESVTHGPNACTPRELYRGLFLDLENHVHFIEPAFTFVEDQFKRVELPLSVPSSSRELIEQLEAWARASLRELPEGGQAAAFLQEAVREFAPVGLSDGVWLQGCLLSNVIEREVGMRMLKQLMIRFAGPQVGEPYLQRYARLMQSLALSPSAVHRKFEDGEVNCSALSYEHALLPVALSLFPMSFGPETVGFNLWMVLVGPCPLLSRLSEMLASEGADLRYLSLHEREVFERLAAQAVEQSLLEASDAAEQSRIAARIARGFVVAHGSYQRWEAERLGERPELTGAYAPAQDVESLSAFAFERYGKLSNPELYHCFANIDLHPAARLFARAYVEDVFSKLGQVLEHDPRLNSQNPPAYSERVIAEIVAEQHEKNVRSRGLPNRSLVSSNSEEAVKGIQEVFDGCWLQGFVDVQRAHFEEYGWLFRIYASEHGDGDFQWNHCQIFRKAFGQLGPTVMLPKTDLRLFQLFEISVSALVTMAVALNSRHFMPEILGINLGIEATGVGGSYIDQWRDAERDGNAWRALAWRLHNSIDNYADGHTKWSLSAVQSYMRRVRGVSSGNVDAYWRRVWRLWRCRDILIHGSDEEQAVLEGYFSPPAEEHVATP